MKKKTKETEDPQTGLTWNEPSGAGGQMWKLLVRALVRTGTGVTLQNESGAYLFAANIPDYWDIDRRARRSETELFGESPGNELARLRQKIDEAGTVDTFEFVSPDGRYFDFTIDNVRLGRRRLTMTTIIETTEERRRERVLRALLREVNHRSKNLLAIIQSIASQTANTSSTISGFLQKFRGRLLSLSQSQDLITESNWSGARFRDLAQNQIERYFGEYSAMITIEGPNPMLSPNQAIHVGLCLHELVVNSVAGFGENGEIPKIVIRCKNLELTSGEALAISWKERMQNGYQVANAKSLDGPEFSSAVLKRIVPAALNGKARIEASRSGFSYDLVFPLNYGEAGGNTRGNAP